MKKNIQSLLFIFLVTITYSQNITVEYEYNFNSNTYKNELTINSSGSLWNYNASDQKTIDENLLDLFIIKKYEDESIYMTEEIFSAKFLVKDSLNRFEWKLENETKEILGYQCFLATTVFRGRKYNAYYTPDLAYPEGPWKFYGLPGLILSVSSEDNLIQYEALKIELDSTKTINLQIKSKDNYITWDEYKKKFILTFDNYIKRIKASGSVDDGADVTIKILSPEIIYPKIQGGDGVKF